MLGLSEPDDDGERGCRKSDVAGGQGGHCVDPRRAAPACDPYRDPMFLDDVLECFRIVSLVPLFDLKFLFDCAAGDVGTSNRRH